MGYPGNGSTSCSNAYLRCFETLTILIFKILSIVIEGVPVNSQIFHYLGNKLYYIVLTIKFILHKLIKYRLCSCVCVLKLFIYENTFLLNAVTLKWNRKKALNITSRQ